MRTQAGGFLIDMIVRARTDEKVVDARARARQRTLPISKKYLRRTRVRYVIFVRRTKYVIATRVAMEKTAQKCIFGGASDHNDDGSKKKTNPNETINPIIRSGEISKMDFPPFLFPADRI